jgi:hypothetical protein
MSTNLSCCVSHVSDSGTDSQRCGLLLRSGWIKHRHIGFEYLKFVRMVVMIPDITEIPGVIVPKPDYLPKPLTLKLPSPVRVLIVSKHDF